MVGPVPGAPGLLLASGHEGSGLTLAPASAELLVDALLGRPGAVAREVAEAVAPRVA
jgi:glycine/D-amino acid oxidase-like deaminating enzyme